MTTESSKSNSHGYIRGGVYKISTTPEVLNNKFNPSGVDFLDFIFTMGVTMAIGIESLRLSPMYILVKTPGVQKKFE